jgi:YVTN family beta-propeller protein
MLNRLKNWAHSIQPTRTCSENDDALSPAASKSTSLSPIALTVGRRSSDLYILSKDNVGNCLLVYVDEFGALPKPIPLGMASPVIAIDRHINTLYVVANSGNSATHGASVCVVPNTPGPPQRISVGLGPVAIAVSEQHRKVYVANYGSTDLTVIDSRTLKTITVSLPRRPISIAIDPFFDQIYVLHSGSLTSTNESAGLTIIDGFSLQLDYVSLPGRPHQMVIDHLRKKLYISDAHDRNGVVFDIVARSFKTWPIGFLHAHLLINAWDNKVYAHPSSEIDYITRFDAKCGKAQIIPLPFRASAITLNSNSNELIAVGKRPAKATTFTGNQRVNEFPVHEYGFITYQTNG